MKVTVNGTEYTCDSAIRGDDYVLLFTDNVLTVSFENIGDFSDFVLTDGEWEYQYITLKADAWVGDSAPYTQTIEHAGITTSNDVLISPRTEGLSDEKIEAFANAMVSPTYQGAGTLTFKAFGEKPTMDLEFNVKALF